MHSLGIFRDSRERAIGGEVGTWLMDASIEEMRGHEGAKAVVDVALESVFNKLKAQHKSAVDAEKGRRQQEADEKEQTRLSAERAKEEKRLAEERKRIKAEQETTKARIMEIINGSKGTVQFSANEFCDLDGNGTAAVGTVGGTTGEVTLAVYTWVNMMQKNDTSISDDQLDEMIEAVVKALNADKVTLAHHALTLGDFATGNLAAD